MKLKKFKRQNYHTSITNLYLFRLKAENCPLHTNVLNQCSIVHAFTMKLVFKHIKQNYNILILFSLTFWFVPHSFYMVSEYSA